MQKMQEKNSKADKAENEKGFAVLRTDTIQLWVWQQGFNQLLDDQSLKILSEDISYRMREAIDVIMTLKHCI
jgi:hypothetical protein